MKAAVIAAPGQSPAYADFREPIASDGMEIITVGASALSRLSKSRSSGSHYSSDSTFPSAAGVDGVGRTTDGRRVYFALPEAPFGALAERSLVRSAQCVPVPDELDDVTAAALANPGMSCWAAFVERAHLRPGETVLVNGATGSAGVLAVQIAKYLGAAKVIATGRNVAELEALKALGADTVIPFSLGAENADGAKKFEAALRQEFAHGINVVIDYLWGQSAQIMIIAMVKAVEDATPIRFVHVGEAAGESTVDLPGAALRSSAIQIMGSGLKSVPFAKLLESIGHVFAAAKPANLQIATQVVPLAQVAEYWDAPGKPRIVFTIP